MFWRHTKQACTLTRIFLGSSIQALTSSEIWHGNDMYQITWLQALICFDCKVNWVCLHRKCCYRCTHEHDFSWLDTFICLSSQMVLANWQHGESQEYIIRVFFDGQLSAQLLPLCEQWSFSTTWRLRLRSTRKTARDSYDLSPIWAHWGLGKWPSASMNLLHYMKQGGWSSSKGIWWPRNQRSLHRWIHSLFNPWTFIPFLHDWMMATDGLWWFVYCLTSFVGKPSGYPGKQISPHLIHWTIKTVSCCALSFPCQILKKKLASVPIMPSKSVVRQSVGLRELTEKLEIDYGTCVEFVWMLQMQNQSASMCSNIFSWILLDSHHHPASQFCMSVAPIESWWLSSEKTRLLRSNL